jgi:hypothetical protein
VRGPRPAQDPGEDDQAADREPACGKAGQRQREADHGHAAPGRDERAEPVDDRKVARIPLLRHLHDRRGRGEYEPGAEEQAVAHEAVRDDREALVHGAPL